MKTRKQLTKNDMFYISALHMAWQCYMIGAGQKVDTTLEEHIDTLADGLDNLRYFYSIASEIVGPEATYEEIADSFLDNAPRLMHESWMAYKMSEGWVYGAKKDKKAREHPNLVEYDLLSRMEKTKDIVICMAFLEASRVAREYLYE